MLTEQERVELHMAMSLLQAEIDRRALDEAAERAALLSGTRYRRARDQPTGR